MLFNISTSIICPRLLNTNVRTRFFATTAGSAIHTPFSCPLRFGVWFKILLAERRMDFPSSVTNLCILADALDPGVWTFFGFVRSLTSKSPIACNHINGFSSPNCIRFRGSFTFTLTDFGSYTSLSTLRTFCYLEIRKTRYMMELTSPSMTGLSPARFAQLCLAHLFTYLLCLILLLIKHHDLFVSERLHKPGAALCLAGIFLLNFPLCIKTAPLFLAISIILLSIACHFIIAVYMNDNASILCVSFLVYGGLCYTHLKSSKKRA